jgi:hypothetical protein
MISERSFSVTLEAMDSMVTARVPGWKAGHPEGR